MDKIKSIFILLFVIVSLNTFNVFSQSRHNVALWGSGGYNTFLTPSSTVFTKGSIGGDIGVGYELHYKRFLLQTGAEFGYYGARLGMDDFDSELQLKDTEGEEYKGHFYFSENTDKYTYGNVNIPLMAGLQTGKFYFMLGGKFSLNVMGTSKVENTLTSTGEYLRFIEHFANMANHDFLTMEQRYEYPINFNINVSASAEIGMYLGSAYRIDGKPKYRIALYGDYGLLDIHNKSKKADLILNKRDGRYYFPGLNSYMLANPTVNKPVNTLYVGLKFTVIFQTSPKDCMCEEFLSPGSKGLQWGLPWAN